MRDLWDTRVPQGRGLAIRPKKLASLGIKRLMERAIWAQGLRKKLENGKKRHPYQANHSLRKWFKTRCEIGGMKPINIETLLSHSTGVSNSYYRPTENELFEDYLKVCQDTLIISPTHRLQKQVSELKEKDADNDFIIKAKLQEKDERIKTMEEQMLSMQESQKEIRDLLKDPIKLMAILKKE